MAPPQAEQQKLRPLPHFPPSVWGCYFDGLPSHDSQFEAYTKEVEELKEKVKNMLLKSTRDLVASVEIINLLCRLGVSYHFESEIDDQLNHMFETYQTLEAKHDYNLYTIALLFRLLREHGYKMSCDVFKKFKNSDGEFNEDIANDVEALLGLYEASFLCVHGEDILDEALDFTHNNLKRLVETLNPNLEKHINKSLFRPFHHGLERMEALHYITFYENKPSKDETLLRFAKLDFNRLQLLYRKELAELSRWWKGLNHTERFPQARDRVVESYFWILGTRCEPQDSFARVTGAKHGEMLTILDDTYDSYGTLDELERFTELLQRYTIDEELDQLPDYMKEMYKAVLDLFGETENHPDAGVRSRTAHTKYLYQRMVRGYFQESKWLHDKEYVPSLEEYIENGLITAGMDTTSSSTLIGIEELEIKDYDWMKSDPKLIRAVSFIIRMMNDLDPHEVIEYEGRDRKGVRSYMNDYGVTQEEAVKGILKMCDNAWKDVNEAFMKPHETSTIILRVFRNHARVADFLYRDNDMYTYSLDMKEAVESLFIRQLPL